MISLDGISCHPCCVPEIERHELDIVLTYVGRRGKSRPNSGTHLYKIS